MKIKLIAKQALLVRKIRSSGSIIDLSVYDTSDDHDQDPGTNGLVTAEVLQVTEHPFPMTTKIGDRIVLNMARWWKMPHLGDDVYLTDEREVLGIVSKDAKVLSFV